jgi:hypothetical protein
MNLGYLDLYNVSDFLSIFGDVYSCLINSGQSEFRRVISEVLVSEFIGLMSSKSATANLLSFCFSVSRDSVVSIASGYRLEG